MWPTVEADRPGKRRGPDFREEVGPSFQLRRRSGSGTARGTGGAAALDGRRGDTTAAGGTARERVQGVADNGREKVRLGGPAAGQADHGERVDVGRHVLGRELAWLAGQRHREVEDAGNAGALQRDDV